MRLIDADVIYEWYKDSFDFDPNEVRFSMNDISHNLSNIPTVNQWIPCSERLPEEDDYRPCYGHDDGVVWWVNDMGIIGLGWYYNSTGQWAYYDEITHSEQSVGKVLAWMPLPHAYKGDK